MAIQDVERLLRRVRRAVGNPDECEIDQQWLEDILEDAIRRYSSYNPIREAVLVSLTDGVRSYDFPSGYFDVDHTVRIGDSSVTGPDLTGYGYNDATALAGYANRRSAGSLHFATMDVRRALHEIEDLDRVFPPRKFWQEGGKLVAESTPSKSEDVYVPLLKYHTSTTFPEIHLDELRLLASSIACYERANQLGKFTEVKVSDVQTIKFRDPAWLRDEGERYFLEFRDRIGATSAPAEIA